MLDVLADNIVNFDNGLFLLADLESTPLDHCNTVLSLHNYKTFSTIPSCINLSFGLIDK
jgi:hypothetical protein